MVLSQQLHLEALDVALLPDELVQRGLLVVDNYHLGHGYRGLPDLLWRAGLKTFHQQLDDGISGRASAS